MDDYKADLDGVNISQIIINEDLGTVEAINEYYESLENKEITRERAFTANMGNGNVEEGIKNIQNQNIFISEIAALFKQDAEVKYKIGIFNTFFEQLGKGL